MLPALFAAVGVGSALIQGYGQYKQYKMQEDMADYNSRIAENEALAQQQALEAERARLVKGQRRLGGKARASVSGRGGTMGGTDLLLLAEEEREKQMDVLELMRQKTIAGIRGKSQTDMLAYQKEGLSSARKWTVATTALGAGAAGAQGYYMGKGLEA